MTDTDNSLELTADEVNNRLDELYAELKWIISMRENSSV